MTLQLCKGGLHACLGIRRPLGVLLQPLPDLLIAQDVECGKGHIGGVQRVAHAPREAAARSRRIPLHATPRLRKVCYKRQLFLLFGLYSALAPGIYMGVYHSDRHQYILRILHRCGAVQNVMYQV